MSVSEAFKEANRARFETDLEFVQCLANPLYLQTLAQQNILSSPAFLHYLEYLRYFKQPAYAKFIHYPQCLHHLELCIESEAFREAIKHDATVGDLAKGQIDHWRTWRELLETGTTSLSDEGAASQAKGDSIEKEAASLAGKQETVLTSQ